MEFDVASFVAPKPREAAPVALCPRSQSFSQPKPREAAPVPTGSDASRPTGGCRDRDDASGFGRVREVRPPDDAGAGASGLSRIEWDGAHIPVGAVWQWRPTTTMGEYGFDRGNDAGVDATAQMPGVDGYSGYSPGYGEGNPAPAKTMVTRRRAVVTAILCSVFAFGVSAAYAESSKGNAAGDKAMASRYETTKSELSATKAENDELKQKLEAANSAKAKAESKAEGLQSQVGTLTSERDACKSDLAAKNGSSAVQPTQGQANGAPSGGSNAPSGTSSRRASSGQSGQVQSGQSGQAGNGDSGYSAPAAPSQEGSVYYNNCAEARAKGAAPIRRGEPGYQPKLDRDGDGIACERR